MSTNTTTPPVTLTFFSLDDFLADLKRREFGFVRCEATTLDRGGGQAGPLRRYMVTLTAHDEQVSEVLACTLIVGECWALFADHEPHHSENLARAKEIVWAHLVDSGLTVLPGVYHHEKDGRATCDLWRFDRESKRLLPVQTEEADR
jgi:hypothetical protein